ncbi:hypothetical protein RJ641_009903 [Dillenia turbinata]|uniref:J domain-containing protein n=1 Tax=Dillenia turbinata TaxID=194707 RepID=A0AAN8Z7T6_9MAGN
MDDFPGILARDFGFKPQGKSAPMAASKSSSTTDSLNFGIGSSSTSSRSKPNWSLDDHDNIFAPSKPSSSQDFSSSFNDVFGGPPKFNSQSTAAQDSSSSSSFNYDSIFRGTADSATSKSSSLPVYDKPVYDDDIFDGVPGLKNSSSVKYDDVFSSMPSRPRKTSAAFDDLLGSLGKTVPELKSSRSKKPSPDAEKDAHAFDDLLPGFGGSSSSTNRLNQVYVNPFENETGARIILELEMPSSQGSQRASANSTKTTSGAMDDPFVVLGSNSTPATSSGLFTDPLEEIGKLNSSGSTRVNSSTRGVFDDIDPLEGLGKSVPEFSSELNNKVKDGSPSRKGSSMSALQSSVGTESFEKTSTRSAESRQQKTTPGNSFHESQEPLFGMPAASSESDKPYNQTTSPASYVNANPSESNSEMGTSPRSEDNVASSDDIWLTVSEIPLFTQPTSAPPPARPPPPRPPKSGAGSFAFSNSRKNVNEFSSFPNSMQYSQGLKSAPAAAKPVVSQIDELEDFAMGRNRSNLDEDVDVLAGEDGETNSVAAAAAMKEAMDRAEAKFRYAKEVREREYAKAARSKEAINLDKDERVMQDDNERELREKHERLDRERRQREREEEEREQKRLEKERERAQELEREREEKEREQRRHERERQREIEREKARQAVERATREARERAAVEARLKAERAAVQRAQAEARERAAAEARERAEKAAAEAKERANAEAREREARLRAERAAVERAAAEARERAATEAREKAAAAARANQQKNENDLDSFFGMSSRPSSAPRPRANPSEPLFDMQSQNRQAPEAARRTSVGSSSSMRKVSSTTNIVDDLSSIFGVYCAYLASVLSYYLMILAKAPPSSGEFQEVDGESEERRRARLERHQRTQERAAKALAEKNQRDLQTQREQAERHRIAETLDVEIKRWAAGKEGNLRALLSTLQYVLWPECGWQPVSLTDLITAAAVKKVYRKATLCIHPDKVQQKGANLQQKYIAEKVFDLLKQ